jgi:histidine triad (HIT) family protein
MSITIFEKILNGEIKTDFVYEDAKVVAFRDIMPQAKIHLLFIHREKSVNAIEQGQNNPEHIADIFRAISNYAIQHQLDQTGLRIVTNVGANGGQTVFYTHFHVLAGEQLHGFGAK